MLLNFQLLLTSNLFWKMFNWSPIEMNCSYQIPEYKELTLIARWLWRQPRIVANNWLPYQFPGQVHNLLTNYDFFFLWLSFSHVHLWILGFTLSLRIECHTQVKYTMHYTWKHYIYCYLISSLFFSCWDYQSQRTLLIVVSKCFQISALEHWQGVLEDF